MTVWVTSHHLGVKKDNYPSFLLILFTFYFVHHLISVLRYEQDIHHILAINCSFPSYLFVVSRLICKIAGVVDFPTIDTVIVSEVSGASYVMDYLIQIRDDLD